MSYSPPLAPPTHLGTFKSSKKSCIFLPTEATVWAIWTIWGESFFTLMFWWNVDFLSGHISEGRYAEIKPGNRKRRRSVKWSSGLMPLSHKTFEEDNLQVKILQILTILMMAICISNWMCCLRWRRRWQRWQGWWWRRLQWIWRWWRRWPPPPNWAGLVWLGRFLEGCSTLAHLLCACLINIHTAPRHTKANAKLYVPKP